MTADLVDVGRVSSRGQIAIPSEMRKELGLEDGAKIIFLLHEDTILLKKVKSETFLQLTEPFRKSSKKIKEADIVDLIHKIRKTKK